MTFHNFFPLLMPEQTRSISRANHLKANILVAVLLFVLFPAISYALTPIARWDVVPNQRITQGETLNVGVVAFSKAGINNVKFTITGQKYSGTTPLQANAMTHNPQTNVYEYWVPLKANDFGTDGAITVQAVVYGKDGGSRDLGTLQFTVNATGKLAQPKAWVGTTGNDATGLVGNQSRPFASVSAAAKAIQASNGGSSNGAIIYFNEGTYKLGTGTINTTNEWITFAAADNANKEKVIFDDGGTITNTSWIKVKGVTIKSSRQYDYVFNSSGPSALWIDNCRVIGFNRWVLGSGPISHGNTYYTDTYIYNVDRGISGGGKLARGLTIEHIGEDAFQNYPFIVNCTLDDQDPGSTLWHADGYQSWGDGPENRIIYNYRVTNAHYQGIFMRATGSMARNNAFVNIFVEMREPGRDGGTGKEILVSGSMYGPWDHALVWHCTFPHQTFTINSETIGNGFTNSSFIGNVFYDYRENVVKGTKDPQYAVPGNSVKNDFLYNHFIWSCVDQGSCNDSSPHYYSKSPDSSSSGSQSVGDPKIASTDPSSASFGAPLTGSPLVDRLPLAVVPADIFGNPRDQKPDIGAFEMGGSFPEVPKDFTDSPAIISISSNN